MAKSKIITRAYRYLAECNDPPVWSTIRARSHQNLVTTICNAPLNFERGNIAITKRKKDAFMKHRKAISMKRVKI